MQKYDKISKMDKGVKVTDLEWKDIYSLGNARIDKEHQALFSIANEAFSVVNPKEKKSKIKNVIARLLAYTKEHFANEERFMDSTDYPKLGLHKHQHKLIIKSMNNFLKEMRTKTISQIEHELAHFIEVWFINHIIHEDKKVAQWASKKTITSHSFIWKNRYTINEPSIDEEHKELFEIANDAFKDVTNNEKKEKIKESLNKLFNYFEKHFQNEEIFMEKIKYDKLEEHKIYHNKIIKELSDFVKKSSSLDIDTIEKTLEDFVEKALIEHIIHEDSKIKNWITLQEDLKTAKELKELS